MHIAIPTYLANLDPSLPLPFLVLSDSNGDPWVFYVDTAGNLTTSGEAALLSEAGEVMTTEAGDPLLQE